MHKTNSPATQGKITYVILPDGSVDVWIRRNEQELPETEEGPAGVEADEIYFKLSSANVASKEEIEADIDFWFDKLEASEEGGIADTYSKENYRAAIRAVLSATCEQVITSGVDVELSTGTEHFSLTEKIRSTFSGNRRSWRQGKKNWNTTRTGSPASITVRPICRKSLMLRFPMYPTIQHTATVRLHGWRLAIKHRKWTLCSRRRNTRRILLRGVQGLQGNDGEIR